jgi:O-antigen ligase
VFVVAFVTLAFLVAPEGVLSGRPLAGPLGYANANGALLTCLCGALLLMAARARHRVYSCSAYLAAIVTAVATFGTRSVAASVAAACAVLAWPIARRMSPRVVAGLAGAVLIAVFATTAVLGATYDGQSPRTGRVDRLVDASLSERRVALWSEALDLIGREPLTGVGIGNFAGLAPTARADADARWAHSEPLQVGAETGLLGLALLAAVAAVVLFALSRSPAGPAAAGALTLAGVGAQAGIDYVLHFPAVVFALAVVVGAAAAPGPADSTAGKPELTPPAP